MKRATSLLGALALMAVGFLFAAPAAHAVTYTINCTDYPGGTGQWPFTGYTKFCGTATQQEAANMVNELNGLSVRAPNLFTKMKNEGATFYYFKTPQEYVTFFSERFTTPPAGTTSAQWKYTALANIPAKTWGNTYFDSTSGVQKNLYTALFNRNKNNVSHTTPTNYFTVNHLAAHEIGHWADNLYFSLVGPTSPTFPGPDFQKHVSYSNMFSDMLSKDFQNIDLKLNCGTGGLFNGKQDSSLDWICTGGTNHNALPVNSKYGSISNSLILASGYPTIFGLQHEIAAQEVPTIIGANDNAPMGSTSYITTLQFGCTRLLMEKLVKNGQLPTAVQMTNVKKFDNTAANCPTSGTGWMLP